MRERDAAVDLAILEVAAILGDPPALALPSFATAQPLSHRATFGTGRQRRTHTWPAVSSAYRPLYAPETILGALGRNNSGDTTA